MGRIKQQMVKRAASELFATVEEFSEDFDKNKKLLKDTMPSKKVRNKVAGQLVRLSRYKRQKEHGRQADGSEREQESEEGAL